MELADARSLSLETQQAQRQRAVAAVVEQGRAQLQVARELGGVRAKVNCWVQRYRTCGRTSPGCPQAGTAASFPLGADAGRLAHPAHSRLRPRAAAAALPAVDAGDGRCTHPAAGRAADQASRRADGIC